MKISIDNARRVADLAVEIAEEALDAFDGIYRGRLAYKGSHIAKIGHSYDGRKYTLQNGDEYLPDEIYAIAYMEVDDKNVVVFSWNIESIIVKDDAADDIEKLAKEIATILAEAAIIVDIYGSNGSIADGIVGVEMLIDVYNGDAPSRVAQMMRTFAAFMDIMDYEKLDDDEAPPFVM